MIDLISTNLM